MAGLLYLILEVCSWIVLAAVIVSWVAPRSSNPAIVILRRVTDPVFDAVRKVVPPIGGSLDLSPLLVLFALQLLRRLLF